MTKTNIQLSDGRLLSIMGANAEQVADYLNKELTRGLAPVKNGQKALITNRLVRTHAAPVTNNEAALELPVLNFEARTRRAPESIVRSVPTPTVCENEETPLEMPVMNFDKARPAQKAHAAPVIDGDETPLAVPVMSF